MILEIERSWGQVPGWFATLDTERQTQLMAHYRVRLSPGKPSGPGSKRRRER